MDPPTEYVLVSTAVAVYSLIATFTNDRFRYTAAFALFEALWEVRYSCPDVPITN